MKLLNTTLVLIFVALIVIVLLQRCHKDKPETGEYTATIQVIDADTDEPIEGARVKVKTTDDECPQITLTTDENGECTFEYSSPDETLTIAVASKRGYANGQVEDIELSYFEDETLVIPLEPKNAVDEGRQIGASGQLKVTLLWQDPTVDLDLHVLQPSGREIYFEDTLDSRTGGRLDADWVPERGNPNRIGENIFWNRPPKGEYVVSVRYYGPEQGETTDCSVIIYQEGKEPETHELSVDYSVENVHVANVNVE